MITKNWKGLTFGAILGMAVMAASWHVSAEQPKDDTPTETSRQNHNQDREHERDQDRNHDREHDHGFSAADRAAFFDARVAAMHAGLTLTPDQEKLWPPVESAIRSVAKTMQEQHQAAREDAPPLDPVQKLQKISANELARGQSLKGLADAAAPLYAQLTEEQKHRLPILLAHLHPHFGMFAGHHKEEEGGHRQSPHERYDHHDGPHEERD